MSEQHFCQEEGCENEAVACYLVDTDPATDEPDDYYCYEHAHDQGYCPMCGMWWAGSEHFDFRLNGTDLCENCYDQMCDALGEDDDHDDEYGIWDDYIEYEDIIEDETGGRYIGPGSEYQGGGE